jgi:alanine dehydrogenase
MTMLIGVPKEVKNHEYRVGLTPASCSELIDRGHQVLVETTAGLGIGFTDADYKARGASIAPTAAEVFAKADMIVKVKEPQAHECEMLREGQILYTYLHLAPDLAQTEALMKSGCSAIAYETVTDDKGQLPLLAPMSEVAGRLSIQAGAHSLEKAQGGRGVLLGGVPGVPSANVVVIGGGVVGLNAIRMAVGMEAHVTVLDRSIPRLKELDDMFASKIRTIYSTHDSLLECLKTADLVIGAVLLPGAAAPKLIKREHLKLMPEGSVIVDVAIDQGGCTETSKPTTHEAPTYVVDGVVHYCVTNMPGNAARTSTMALNNATLPYALELADKGLGRALSDNPHLRNGLNVHQGKVTCPAVAKAHGMETVAA